MADAQGAGVEGIVVAEHVEIFAAEMPPVISRPEMGSELCAGQRVRDNGDPLMMFSNPGSLYGEAAGRRSRAVNFRRFSGFPAPREPLSGPLPCPTDARAP